MSEKNQASADTTQQPQAELPEPKLASPNLDVQAPQNVHITEGYEPPKTKAAAKSS